MYMAGGDLHRVTHTAGARRGDFSGGRLIFHDEDVDRVVLPEAGLLVAFTSGGAYDSCTSV